MPRCPRFRTAIPILIFLFVSWTACSPAPPEAPPAEPAADATTTGGGAAALAYRNAVNEPPEGWTGPVFQLSHDYPPTDPGKCPEDVCGWLYKDVDFSSTDFSDGWAEYMQSILAYVKEGQTLDPEWNVTVNGETRWFHVPWMAYDPKVGREFVHGLTSERVAAISDLLGTPHGLPGVPGSEGKFETWAFGVYNPWGGHAFGRGWNASGEPVMNGDLPAGLPFAEGTLVAKLLFTTATPEEVGYLEDSPEWTANRHVEVNGCERQPQPVHLVQMDVAVVDSRSPTRWIYGTYGYNGTLRGASPWQRLSPLGVQWGADGQTFPAVEKDKSQPISESALAAVNIYEHFGCEGRLAGPVDNKLASCMSCHVNGYVHEPVGSETVIGTNVPPIFGFEGICITVNENNKLYFTNRTSATETWPQYPNTFQVDTSLQLLVAFSQYGVYKTNGKPNECKPSGG